MPRHVGRLPPLRREALKGIVLDSKNFEVQEEVLVRAYARGFSIVEVPFVYFPRSADRSHAKLLSFGYDIGRSALRLWKLRNSLDSSDYDERGFYSIIPIQRYWHRRRHQDRRDVGARHRPHPRRRMRFQHDDSEPQQRRRDGLNLGKLRFLRRYKMPLVRGSAFALPFSDQSFDCLISQEVIEHLPYDEVLFTEMRRVLRPGGVLILGTPDYASWLMANYRTHLRIPDAGRLQGRAHHPLHARLGRRADDPLRIPNRRSRLRRPLRPLHPMPQNRTPRTRPHQHPRIDFHRRLHRRIVLLALLLTHRKRLAARAFPPVIILILTALAIPSSTRADSCTPSFPYAHGWLGADAAYSIPLENHRTLWLFGDTFVSTHRTQTRTRAGSSMIANSIAISSCRAAKWIIDYHWNTFAHRHRPRAFFDSRTRSFRYWPLDGFLYNRTLYVALLRVRSTHARGPFAFKLLGVDLATITNPDADPRNWSITYRALSRSRTSFPGGSIVVRAPYVYLLGVIDHARHSRHALILTRIGPRPPRPPRRFSRVP